MSRTPQAMEKKIHSACFHWKTSIVLLIYLFKQPGAVTEEAMMLYTFSFNFWVRTSPACCKHGILTNWPNDWLQDAVVHMQKAESQSLSRHKKKELALHHFRFLSAVRWYHDIFFNWKSFLLPQIFLQQ